MDQGYQKLLQQVQDGVAWRYWIEDGLLMLKNSRLYVLDGGGLRRQLTRESHDSQLALLSHTFVWPKMENDIMPTLSLVYCANKRRWRGAKGGLNATFTNYGEAMDFSIHGLHHWLSEC